MIEVTKKIKLKLDSKGKNIICRDLDTLTMVMGSKSVSGNFSYYKIAKRGTNFIVSKETIRNRIKAIEDRIRRDQEKIDIMKQVI